MIVKHELTMDLGRRGILPRINAVQDDRYSRDLVISLHSHGTAWEPGEGVTAIVRYAKPDGTGGSYNVLPDGTSAWQIEGNVLTVALAPQVCTAVGQVKVAVSLVCGEAVISTLSIAVDVQPVPGLSLTSEDYYKHTGFLFSTGWEPGKYLGTGENGNVVAVDGPGVDATLTQEGQAADAKAVGDALSGTVQSINGVPPDEKGNISLSISAMPLPASAAVGQFFRVSAVSAGKVSAVEPVAIKLGDPVVYQYNGHELHALPDILSEYPYVFFTAFVSDLGWTSYTLHAVSEVKYTTGTYNGEEYRAIEYASGKQYGAMVRSGSDIGDWEEEEVSGLYCAIDNIAWANFDVVNENGAVILTGSDPVPVYDAASSDSGSGVIFSYVELTTPIEIGAEATLSETESAALTAAAITEMPAVIKCALDITNITAVANYMIEEGVISYTLTYLIFVIIITKNSDTSWTVQTMRTA